LYIEDNAFTGAVLNRAVSPEEVFRMDIHRRLMHRNKRPVRPAGRAERSADSGFTLVEGLVAAMISAVLAGVLFTVMKMNNDGVKDGAVNAKVRSQYEIAIAEIGTYARRAHAVLDDAAGETYQSSLTLTDTTTSKIMMYDEAVNGTGIPIRGFWVDGGELKEWRPEWGEFRSFVVGAWPTVSVPDATPFQLSADRKTMTVSMRVSAMFAGVTAVTPARGEVFICRN
jgi:type II secretory pathway pseudopilin PulG